MKRSFWLGLAVLLVIVPVIAKPEHLVLGPYSVSFDAGKERQDWNITKKESETYLGSPEIFYRTNSASIAISIQWLYLKDPKRAYESIDDWRKYNEEECKDRGMTCKSYPRVIDGRDGSVAPMYYQNGSFKAFGASWFLNNITSVIVISYYPWDEGTLQLLKTINVTTTDVAQVQG